MSEREQCIAICTPYLQSEYRCPNRAKKDGFCMKHHPQRPPTKRGERILPRKTVNDHISPQI